LTAADGSAVLVTTAELAELEAGRKLPDAHPLTKLIRSVAPDGVLVAHSTPLMQHHDSAEAVFSDRFASVLARAYETPVLRDPWSAETAKRIAAWRAFDKSAVHEATAVIAPAGVLVDHKIIQNIEDDLTTNGVHVIEFDPKRPFTWTERSGRAVIVITGHADKALADFVRSLGDANVFRGNVVLDNSCGTPLTRQLIAEITGKFGATTAFGFDGKILAQDVQPFLHGIAPLFKGGSATGSGFFDEVRRQMRAKNLSGNWVVSSYADATRPITA
jgi:hypothetical protein